MTQINKRRKTVDILEDKDVTEEFKHNLKLKKAEEIEIKKNVVTEEWYRSFGSIIQKCVRKKNGNVYKTQFCKLTKENVVAIKEQKLDYRG